MTVIVNKVLEIFTKMQNEHSMEGSKSDKQHIVCVCLFGGMEVTSAAGSHVAAFYFPDDRFDKLPDRRVHLSVAFANLSHSVTDSRKQHSERQF